MYYRLLKYFGVRKLRRERLKTRYNQRMWEEEKPLIEIQNNIDKEKKELIGQRIQAKFPSWGKMLLIILFINFTILEIFIGWVTVKSFSLALATNMMPDFTPLITLIGAVIGQTLSYGIYSSKSKAENTKGGIVYETAMANFQPNEEIDNEGGVG